MAQDPFLSAVTRVGDAPDNLAPPQRFIVLDVGDFDVTHEPDTVCTGNGAAGEGCIRVRVKGSGSVPTVTSSGAETKVLTTLSLPAGSVAGLDVTINAVSGSWWFTQRGHSTDTVNTLGGGVSYTPSTSSNFPIWPSTSGDWSAGVVTLSGTGPKATITGCADNGSGGTTVTVSGGLSGPLSSTLTGQSVTISGVVGGTGINGTHVATRIDATNFDIPVAFVGYTSGGQVVLTTPPAITWGISASLPGRVP